MIRLEVLSESAIVAFSDPSVRLPSGQDQDALVRELEPMARAGLVFYLIADDPLRCRIGLLAGQPPASELDREFEPSAGAFRLDLPGGQAAVFGWNAAGEPVMAGAAGTAAGTHMLSVLSRRPFESSRHAEDMEKLLGAEWAYMQRVNKLGLVGCLPIAITVLTVIAKQWHWLWYALPLLALSWLPYLLLSRGRRYRAAESRSAEVEKAHPHYVVSLMPTDQSGLAGGFLRI